MIGYLFTFIKILALCRLLRIQLYCSHSYCIISYYIGVSACTLPADPEPEPEPEPEPWPVTNTEINSTEIEEAAHSSHTGTSDLL
jgi:hypothetical protein